MSPPRWVGLDSFGSMWRLARFRVGTRIASIKLYAGPWVAWCFGLINCYGTKCPVTFARTVGDIGTEALADGLKCAEMHSWLVRLMFELSLAVPVPARKHLPPPPFPSPARSFIRILHWHCK